MSAEAKAVKRILIINLAFIGDVLLATPVARALRQAYPDAGVDMMVIPLAAGIARGNPYVDEVIEYDKRGRHKKISELFKLIAAIRARRYDLAVTTNFAPRGAMLAWASGIPRRVGYDAQHAGWFLTDKASPHRPVVRHEAENYLDVLKPLGITTEDTSLAFRLDPADAASMAAKVVIDSDKPIVAICPVGSYRLKSWPPASFAVLIRRLAPLVDCYLIGARGEAGRLEEVNTAAGHLAKVLAGTLTLGELAAFLARARLLVSVDTGPMHIANAVGTPVVALFGPTDPKGWGPRGPRDVILHTPVDCSPCWGRTACSDHRCMNLLDADRVTAAALALLGKGSNDEAGSSYSDL